MNHLSDDELVLQYYGDEADAWASEHVRNCADCQDRLTSLTRLMSDVDAWQTPERGDGYGRQVWAQIGPEIRRPKQWRWFAGVAAVASLVVGAFVADAITRFEFRRSLPRPWR